MELTCTQAPLISIVICTYNNAESLAITLQQIFSQEISRPEKFELIVIDNNSSPETSQVLSSFKPNRFSYRYYVEPQQGVSHARNTGLEHARGQYILYTDDDADIPTYWLENYLSSITTTNADCVFGGISVIWDQSPPWWYDKDRYQGFFAALDYGDQELQIQTKHTPFFTKNACIKKSCLKEIGGFNTELGRKGNILAGGEDILAYYQLIEANKKIYYCPELSIGHRLKLREYSEKNIAHQYLACAKPILKIAQQQPGKRLFNKPLGVLEIQIKEVINCAPKLLSTFFTHNKKEFFYQKLRFYRAFLIILFWFNKV